MSAKSRGSTIPASIHSTTSYKSCCEIRAKDPKSKTYGCGPDEPPKGELKRFENRYIQDRDIGRKNVWNFYNKDAVIGLGSISNIYRVTRKLKKESSSHIASSIFCGSFSSSKHIKQSVEENESSKEKYQHHYGTLYRWGFPDEPPKGELKRFENRYIQDRDIGRKNVWNFYNKDAVIGLGSISNIYRATRKLKKESSSHIASSIFCGCFSSSKHIKQSVEENESSKEKYQHHYGTLYRWGFPDEPPKGELKRFENRYIQDRDIGRKNVWNFYNKDAVIGLGSISNIYRVTRKLKKESSSHIASSIFCGSFSSSKHIKQSVEENESSKEKYQHHYGTFVQPDEPPKGELKRFENRYIQDRDIVRKNVWNFYNKDAVIGLGSISNIYRVTRKLKKESSSHIASNIFCGCFSSSKHIKQSVAENDSSHDEKYFVLKMIDTRLVNDDYLQEMRNEIDIFQSLNHPNILKAYETFHTMKNISIIMELCTGGDLYSRRPYSEQQAAEIISSLMNALTYMHSNQIMNRDLKFENVMFESNEPDAQVKIIDFGLSTKYLDPNAIINDRVGTVYTMAPEVIKRKSYTYKVDMFSQGVIAYMLLSGSKPFWGDTKKEVADKIVECEYNMDSQVWNTITQDAQDFVKALLQKSPEKRLSAKEALNHTWLKKISLLSTKEPDPSLMDEVEKSLVSYADSEFKKQLKHLNLNDEALEKIFSCIDIHQTGSILNNEFIAATLEAQQHLEESQLRDAFDSIDSDSTGFISKENLCHVLGETCHDDYVDKMIEVVDANKDGSISYNEFIEFFRGQRKFDMEK
ncbi:hypothetical protein CTEN210_13003 [Chaetoceros tenuissimus]|uniref:Calmodulin n=1 Tax=Chaetoceros tenuissimus TaxID=426638 RepID=A0AAD3D2R6_9STRA|nr:hypothetical protein CTEN210_13003 [Chaetoceros tenuissimus]